MSYIWLGYFLIKQKVTYFIKYYNILFIIDYESKADHYITHILGFEGRCSLTSFLEDEGLIQSLTSSVNILNDLYQLLEL